jgi:predicted nucleic acid-binding protein
MLVDTSVWIEFFARRTRALTTDELGAMAEAIADGEVCIVMPIYAELLSGARHDDLEVRALLSTLRFVDLDWNTRTVWERVAALGEVAHTRRLPIPGLVDRMILAAAEESGEPLWALDGPLRRLARARHLAAR